MMRPAPSHRAWLCAATLLWLMAGCGGESSVSVGVPTENNGPVISGQVAMPNGRLAAAPSALERFAAAVVARAEALVAGNVRAVGADIEVRLLRIGPGNIKNGTIQGGEIVNRATTRTDGAFALRMPTGTDPGSCRYVLEVGNSRDHTVTRAFVDATRVDIDFESEATVRLILDEIKAGHVALCDLSAGEILSVRNAVQDSESQAFGETVAALNASAEAAAGSDPGVQSALGEATGRFTPIPEPTNTAPPPPTNTAPVPTATAPPVPTRTNTTLPTRTNTTAPTNTVAPTQTNTPAATNTVAPTSSATPVPTNTATTVPTNTSAPTSTATAIPPTATATAQPTATATGVAPRVSLGVVAGTVGVIAGTAGLAVDVPIILEASGAQIAAVSADIGFDSESLSVVAGGSGPDCRVDARLMNEKEIVARVADLGDGRGRLRVGVVGLDNNVVISSGRLGTCRFLVAPSASGSLFLDNNAEAAGQQAQAIAVESIDGRIDVSAAPAALGLGAGTAAAGATADITATLVPRGLTLAAVSSDIRFDPGRVSTGAAPDCTLTDEAAALDKEIVTRVLPVDDQGRAGLRVGVFGRTNNTALPAGAVFSCRFRVESGGPPIALAHTAEGAAPSAQLIGLLGEPGTITVP